jgi:Tetratricopeptide repeat
MSIYNACFLVSLAAICSAGLLAGSNARAQDLLEPRSTNSSAVGHRDFDSEKKMVSLVAGTQAGETGRVVLAVQPIRKLGGSSAWAVITYQRERIAGTERAQKTFPNPELWMYVKSADAYRCVFRKGSLDDPRFKGDPPLAVGLKCLDLNGDGIDEVVVTQERLGASWEPGCAIVFEPATNQLIPLATLTSHFRVNVERLGGYDQPVISITYAIGTTLAHAAQPNWTDYYSYDGQRMILANGFLPKQFRAWPGDLKKVLRNHPDDPEIWYYLGAAYKILNETQKANRAFAKASSLGYRETNKESLEAGIQVEQNAVPNAAAPHQ